MHQHHKIFSKSSVKSASTSAPKASPQRRSTPPAKGLRNRDEANQAPTFELQHKTNGDGPSTPPLDVSATSKADAPPIQRLFFNTGTGRLYLPEAYYKMAIPFDKPHKVPLAVALGADVTKSLENMHGDGDIRATLLTYMKKGLILGQNIQGITTYADLANEEVTARTGEGAQPGTSAALKNTFASYRKVLKYGNNQQFYDPDSVDPDFALLPGDYIPETADLPGGGTSVKKGSGHWPKVCALISVVFADGNQAKIKELTGYEGNDFEESVQKLHKYFMDQGIEYDEAGTHPAVFGKFSYSLVFTGPSSWVDLHKKAALAQGEYIFDIKGHAVKTTVLQALPAKGETMEPENVTDYYDAVSDNDNYRENPYEKFVYYVFKK